MIITEQDTRYIIDNNLTNKGWILDPNDPNRNVYFETTKTEEHRNRLRGKRPDYVLYKKGTDRPIAIIEAKKGGINLNEAIKQATEYAKILDIELVFVTNGSGKYQSIYVPNGKELLLNGNVLDELIREKEMLLYIENKTNEIETIPKQVRVSRDDLIRIFRNSNDTLRDEGIRAGIERFSEFANILFLKLISEDGKKTWWNSIRHQSNDDIIGYMNDYVIKQIQNEYGGNVFIETNIKNPKTLREIIDELDPLILSTIDTDIKGDAFEYFLEKTTSTENDLGEYFTPRNIVKSIISIIDPKPKESIYDPFCGTGGFLTEAFSYIRENKITDDKEDISILKNNTLFGHEITTTSRIAKMNMILHGDGHSGVQQLNSLMNPVFYYDIEEIDRYGRKIIRQEMKRFDIVVTNMPFSQKITRKISINGKMKTINDVTNLYNNGLARNNGDAVCVLHCLNSLKQGGRMAIVVPEGFLFRKDTIQVRKHLLKSAKLQCVISLPRGVFLPYTPVKTYILYLTNAHEQNNQKEYWYFDVKSVGYTLNNNRKKIKENDLNKIDDSDIRKLYKKSESRKEELENNLINIGFEKVSINDITVRGYNFASIPYHSVTNSSTHKILTIHQLIENGLITIQKGKMITKETVRKGNIPVIAGGKSIPYYHNEHTHNGNIITISTSGAAGYVWYHDYQIWASDCNVLYSNDENQLVTKYLYFLLLAKQEDIYKLQHGTCQPHIYENDLYDIQVSLPSIEVQKNIVDEISIYQKIVDGAKQIVDSWNPIFNLNTIDYKVVTISEICNICRGGSPRPINDYITDDINGINWLKIGDVDKNAKYVNSTCQRITKLGLNKTIFVKKGSLILSNSMSFGRPYILNIDTCVHDGWIVLQDMSQEVNKDYLYYEIRSNYVQNQFNCLSVGTTVKNLNIDIVNNVTVRIPSLDEQEKIVNQIATEYEMIEYQKNVIELFENKIKHISDSIYG